MEPQTLQSLKEEFLSLVKTSIPLFVTILALAALIFFLIGIGVGRIIQSAKMHAIVKKEREAAVRKSRAVLGGQFGEQLAPFLPKFPCNPGDVHFIGKPVDYIAFPGTASGEPITDIILIEVKSGQSKLSEREKQIREAVKNGRIRYVEYRLPF